MKKIKSKTVQFLYDRYVGDEPERISSYEIESRKIELGMKINKLRNKVKMTEAELAKMIGTTVETIEDIELADYECDHDDLIGRIFTVLSSIFSDSVESVQPESVSSYHVRSDYIQTIKFS